MNNFSKTTNAWIIKQLEKRFAQQTPTTTPAQTPETPTPAAPIKSKRQFPASLENCKVSFEGSHTIHCIIEHSGMPNISFVLTPEQIAVVNQRLSQKSWGAGGGTWSDGKNVNQHVPFPADSQESAIQPPNSSPGFA